MNKNIIIVLAGGVVIATLVAMIVSASLGGKKDKEHQAKDNKPEVQILVAAGDLSIGKTIGDADMKWQTWPEQALFPGAIRRENEGQSATDTVSGRLNQKVVGGQPILPSYFVEGGKSNFMAASLGKGMRAVGVPVKAETMAGGFIGPGDYVDVILTYKVRIIDTDNIELQNMISEFASETIIENVKVLAVDQSVRRDEDKPNVGRTVTLEVSSEQAEQLSLSSEMGEITLAMRSLGDQTPIDDVKITTDVKATRILRDVARIQSTGNGSDSIVRVYNGENIQNVPVRQNMVVPND